MQLDLIVKNSIESLSRVEKISCCIYQLRHTRTVDLILVKCCDQYNMDTQIGIGIFLNT